MKTTARLLLLLFAAAAAATAGADERDERTRSFAIRRAECPRDLFQLGEGGPEILRLGSFGYLGVQATPLTPELRRHFGVPEEAGVLIGRVEEGSPAEAAGLRVGDVLTRVDGEDVTSGGRLVSLVRRYEKDEQATLEYWRDGKVAATTAVLDERQRCGFDVGTLIGLDRAPHVDPERLPRIELKDLPHVELLELRGLDAEELRDAAGSLREALESQDWRRHVERLRDADLSRIEERLHEAMERLHELEDEVRTEKKRIRSKDGDVY